MNHNRFGPPQSNDTVRSASKTCWPNTQYGSSILGDVGFCSVEWQQRVIVKPPLNYIYCPVFARDSSRSDVMYERVTLKTLSLRDCFVIVLYRLRRSWARNIQGKSTKKFSGVFMDKLLAKAKTSRGVSPQRKRFQAQKNLATDKNNEDRRKKSSTYKWGLHTGQTCIHPSVPPAKSLVDPTDVQSSTQIANVFPTLSTKAIFCPNMWSKLLLKFGPSKLEGEEQRIAVPIRANREIAWCGGSADSVASSEVWLRFNCVFLCADLTSNPIQWFDFRFEQDQKKIITFQIHHLCALKGKRPGCKHISRTVMQRRQARLTHRSWRSVLVCPGVQDVNERSGKTHSTRWHKCFRYWYRYQYQSQNYQQTCGNKDTARTMTWQLVRSLFWENERTKPCPANGASKYFKPQPNKEVKMKLAPACVRAERCKKIFLRRSTPRWKTFKRKAGTNFVERCRGGLESEFWTCLWLPLQKKLLQQRQWTYLTGVCRATLGSRRPWSSWWRRRAACCGAAPPARRGATGSRGSGSRCWTAGAGRAAPAEAGCDGHRCAALKNALTLHVSAQSQRNVG